MAEDPSDQSLTVSRKPVERQEIAEWVQTQFQGKSYRTIAKEFGRDKDTVRKHLQGPEAKKLREEIGSEIDNRVKMRMRGLADRAVDSWAKQLDLADEGQRANHLPAKDLLTHSGAVDIAVPRQERGTQILIQIGGGAPQDIEAVEAQEIETIDAETVPPKS